MDDFLKKNDNLAKEGPSIEEKKIEFKQIKECRTSKTYMFNLEHYIKDEETMKNVIKDLKKSFGTSCTWKKTEEFGFGFGFNGDFAAKIKTYLLEKKFVEKEAFK